MQLVPIDVRSGALQVAVKDQAAFAVVPRRVLWVVLQQLVVRLDGLAALADIMIRQGQKIQSVCVQQSASKSPPSRTPGQSSMPGPTPPHCTTPHHITPHHTTPHKNHTTPEPDHTPHHTTPSHPTPYYTNSAQSVWFHFDSLGWKKKVLRAGGGGSSEPLSETAPFRAPVTGTIPAPPNPRPMVVVLMSGRFRPCPLFGSSKKGCNTCRTCVSITSRLSALGNHPLGHARAPNFPHRDRRELVPVEAT